MKLLRKYIIALLPLEVQPYIKVAQENFSDFSAGYILGADSWPHITLCQIYCSENRIKQIEKDLRHFKKVPQPSFTGISFIKDKKLDTLGWVELSVARDPSLITFHKKIIKIIRDCKLSCINDIGELYRPHLTLARIHTPSIINLNHIHTLLNPPAAVLAIGQADALGQLIKLLNTFP